MPAIQLTWSALFLPQVATPYGNALWIQLLEWRRPPGPPGVKLPETAGLYVIENPAGQPVYAGRALDIRERFDGRTDVLSEFGLAPLAANVVPTHVVRLASVNPRNEIPLAENWLIRSLKLADAAAANHTLTNIALTGPMVMPNDPVGLQIANVPSAVGGAALPPYYGPNYAYAPNSVL